MNSLVSKESFFRSSLIVSSSRFAQLLPFLSVPSLPPASSSSRRALFLWQKWCYHKHEQLFFVCIRRLSVPSVFVAQTASILSLLYFSYILISPFLQQTAALLFTTWLAQCRLFLLSLPSPAALSIAIIVKLCRYRSVSQQCLLQEQQLSHTQLIAILRELFEFFIGSLPLSLLRRSVLSILSIDCCRCLLFSQHFSISLVVLLNFASATFYFGTSTFSSSLIGTATTTSWMHTYKSPT